MRTLASALQVIYSHRLILLATVYRDIRVRYAGSLLGLGWLLAYPLLLLGTYAAVYLCIFKVRLGLFEADEYVVLIFCGLIPFLGFSEALVSGVTSISGNANLVRNTLFPVELLPVKAVLTSQCTQLAGLSMLLVVLAVMGKLGLPFLLILPIWLCQVSFSIGLGWILGSLNIFVRDLQTIAGVAVMLLMMLSPIAYTPEMVPNALRPLLALNPLAHFIAAYQKCLMLNTVPAWSDWLVLVCLAVGSLALGYFVISRLKTIVADSL